MDLYQDDSSEELTIEEQLAVLVIELEYADEPRLVFQFINAYPQYVNFKFPFRGTMLSLLGYCLFFKRHLSSVVLVENGADIIHDFCDDFKINRLINHSYVLKDITHRIESVMRRRLLRVKQTMDFLLNAADDSECCFQVNGGEISMHQLVIDVRCPLLFSRQDMFSNLSLIEANALRCYFYSDYINISQFTIQGLFEVWGISLIIHDLYLEYHMRTQLMLLMRVQAKKIVDNAIEYGLTEDLDRLINLLGDEYDDNKIMKVIKRHTHLLSELPVPDSHWFNDMMIIFNDRGYSDSSLVLKDDITTIEVQVHFPIAIYHSEFLEILFRNVQDKSKIVIPLETISASLFSRIIDSWYGCEFGTKNLSITDAYQLRFGIDYFFLKEEETLNQTGSISLAEWNFSIENKSDEPYLLNESRKTKTKPKEKSNRDYYINELKENIVRTSIAVLREEVDPFFRNNDAESSVINFIDTITIFYENFTPLSKSKQLEAKIQTLESRMDGLDSKLDQILAHLGTIH